MLKRINQPRVFLPALLAALILIGGFGASALAAFTDNGDGTVTDTATGLMWQQADDGVTRNWQNALSYSESLELAGHTDWRLPNIRELRTLVDYTRYGPAIDPVFSCRLAYYWSGSTYAAFPDYAWHVSFEHGFDFNYLKTDSDYVRCVRNAADTTPPAAPAALDLAAEDDTGASDSDNITSQTSGLTISGTGENGATVQLYNGAVEIPGASATVSGGVFAIDISLSEGVHSITAKQTDAAGNPSEASDPLAITVETTPPAAPTVSTGSASSVTQNTATVAGTVNPNGLSTSYWFEYGETAAYGLSTSPESAGAGSGAVNVNAGLSGLLPDTTYHYRIAAQNSIGTSYGDDQTFKTAGNAPTVVTGSATPDARGNAVLNGTVNPNGSETTYYFEYGASTAYGMTTAAVSAGSGNSAVAVTADISGLLENTTYHYRLSAENGAGETKGEDGTFATEQFIEAPEVSVLWESLVTTTSAQLNAVVIANGSETTVEFEYGPTSALGSVEPAREGTIEGWDVHTMTCVLTSLTPAQTYYYRVKATSSEGTVESGIQSFKAVNRQALTQILMLLLE